MSGKGPLQIGNIETLILLIRGEKVILDADLAAIYGVTTKRLNEQVKRNILRFPSDFRFQLTQEEKAQVVANCDHLKSLRFSNSKPFAFTEHGAIMAASVLNTPKAIETSVFIVRAFIKLREMLVGQHGLQQKIVAIEKQLAGHDTRILELVKLIKQLLSTEPVPKKRRIGFY